MGMQSVKYTIHTILLKLATYDVVYASVLIMHLNIVDDLLDSKCQWWHIKLVVLSAVWKKPITSSAYFHGYREC